MFLHYSKTIYDMNLVEYWISYRLYVQIKKANS